jgi:hypothetical protein
MNIMVSYMCPPIPTRRYDFVAYDESTLDVCTDEDCKCRQEFVGGYGATSDEAIQEFVYALLDRLGVSVSEMMEEAT